MANNLDSNITELVLKSFMKAFEANRVLTRTVDTRTFQGKFNPSTGTTMNIKRAHDYTTIRSETGDISSETKDSIISGQATATVQQMFTGALEYSIIDEALKLDQLDQIMEPEAARIVTDLEVDFAKFMLNNCALVHGTPGTAISTWLDVANAGALMLSTGIPTDMPRYYVMNPFSNVALSNLQNQLPSVDKLIQTAWEEAQISRNFGGMKAMMSQSLASLTTPTTTDLAGTLSATPTATYLAAKDTMQQTLALTGFTNTVTIQAGTVLEIPTRFILNQATREPALDASGNNIPWRGVVLEDASMVSGVATVIVSSPAIHETTGTRDGAYNTVVDPLVSGDVINILNASATTFQPNMFYHPKAFSITTVNIPKLFSTSSKATTKDGFTIAVSMYSDGDAFTQKIRWDLLPVYAPLNPFFAGQGWG